MNTKLLQSFSTVFALLLTGGCTFFEEPVQLDELTAKAPAQTGTLPATPVASTVPPPSSAPKTTAPAASNGRLIPPPSPGAATGTIFTIGMLEDLPDDAANIAVVHFTVTGNNRNTDRDTAMCKALRESIPPTPIDQIPASPGTVVLWPVSRSDSGSTCLEMLTNYEPVDISNETSAKVNNTVAGPFLLTRNNSLRKRMIFDMSYRPRQSLKNAVAEWQALLGSDPANWPAYRSSR